jgi:AraC-like DNA-binding protein
VPVRIRDREPETGSVSRQYAEHAAAPALRPYVECYWSGGGVEGASVDATHRVLPDGCMDIIFVLGGGTRVGASVVGTMTTALVVPTATRAEYLAVRFRPGQAYHVLGVPASALTDRAVALDDVWGDGGELLERLLAESSLDARVRVLDFALVRRLKARSRPDGLVDAAVDRIRAARGRVEIAALCGALGVTRQHLARQFGERVGVAPKVLARVVRLQNVVQRVLAGDAADWSGLAYECGYADQSHLVGEFRALVGLTPGEYARTR